MRRMPRCWARGRGPPRHHLQPLARYEPLAREDPLGLPEREVVAGEDEIGLHQLLWWERPALFADIAQHLPQEAAKGRLIAIAHGGYDPAIDIVEEVQVGSGKAVLALSLNADDHLPSPPSFFPIPPGPSALPWGNCLASGATSWCFIASNSADRKSTRLNS